MKEFQKQIQNKFNQMMLSGKLFRVALTGQQIWDLYINSFSKDNNPKFRDPNSSSKNCNHCNNFIRRYGNIVSIDENYKIVTMFDIDCDEEFENTCNILSDKIINSTITEVFFETFNELNKLPYESCSKSNSKFQLGTSSNPKRYTKEEAEKYGVVKPLELRVFDHLYLSLDKSFVDMSGASVEALMGQFRDNKNVFQRAMEEISLDTLLLVKDLINQGSLLDGQTHLYKIEQFLPLKANYDLLLPKDKDNYCWKVSYKLPIAKFKNELIGVLCSELSQGEELNKAVQSWNKRVDPVNYMKTKAPITKKQIEEAKEFVESNGYVESFNRRMATIEDIKASEILHLNSGDGRLKSVSIFDNVKSTNTRHKRNEFEGVEEVSIDKFMSDILPGCTSVEAFLTNSMEGNMVSLTTANIKESKPIFKWDNNYSWTFNGNLAGKSMIKDEVISKGGNVNGVLRFSMIWNDSKEANDSSDLDAWCQTPDYQLIGFNTSYRKDRGGLFSSCGGQLDLDNTNPAGRLAVENIYFQSLNKLKNGNYKFWVNQYSARNSKGFKAEIEFDGEIYNYNYDKPVSGNVIVANIEFEDGKFTINHQLPETNSSKELYGLETNQFHKVNLVCLSPNHWADNKVGNLHYFFMLDKCKSPNSIRSFHNENLISELANHRRVLEVLGTQCMIESTDKQLSGLGFNATVKDEVILKLQGTHKRIIKVKFEGMSTKSLTTTTRSKVIIN